MQKKTGGVGRVQFGVGGGFRVDVDEELKLLYKCEKNQGGGGQVQSEMGSRGGV